MLEQLLMRYKFMQRVYHYHTTVEDEVVYPELEVRSIPYSIRSEQTGPNPPRGARRPTHALPAPPALGRTCFPPTPRPRPRRRPPRARDPPHSPAPSPPPRRRARSAT